MSILVTILSVLLSSPSYPVRSAAHAALSQLAAPPDLLPLLDHADPEVRLRAGMLLDDVGYAGLRREVASFAGLPYIDADPGWLTRGGQHHLTAAILWHRERELPVGEAADWSEYRRAMLSALEAGDVTTDAVTLAVMLERTAVYRELRRWVR